MTDLVPPSKSLGYSDIYLDFLAGKDSAKHFFSASHIDDVALALDTLSYEREQIETVLEKQNSSFKKNILINNPQKMPIQSI